MAGADLQDSTTKSGDRQSRRSAPSLHHLRREIIRDVAKEMHARYEEGEFWSFSRVAATAAARHLARMNEDGKRTTGPVVLTAVVGREVREALHAAAPEYDTKIDLIVDRALRAYLDI